MPTITESGAPGGKPAHRVVVGIFAVLSGVIVIALASLVVLLVQRAGWSTDPKFGVVLSLISSFIVFFTVIAVQTTSFVLKPRSELMPLAGWRILAGVLVLIGVVAALLFHWIAMLTWLAMALFCLLKEPRVQAWIRNLGI